MKPQNEDMKPEYDFSHGVRGKYVSRLAEGANVIVLDSDVASIFPDSTSVNEALRAIAGIIQSHAPKQASRRIKHT
jgi:hypothetical protein